MRKNTTRALALTLLVGIVACGAGGGAGVAELPDAVVDAGGPVDIVELSPLPDVGVPDSGADEVGGGDASDVIVSVDAWPVSCLNDSDCPDIFPGQLPCQRALCDRRHMVCVAATAVDGTACDDGDACTVETRCQGGLCLGRERFCDDGAFCTRDRCDGELGCVHVPRASPCEDGDPCTEGEACEAGACVGGQNVCPCDADEDCDAHDDGDPCTGAFVCGEDGCRVDPDTVVRCPEPAPDGCVWSRCDSETGGCVETALPDGHPCSDGDACTLVDRCRDGGCEAGSALACNDDNACTEDQCDPDVGCLFAPAARPCSDRDGCTEGDQCFEGVCLPGGVNDCLEETCHAARVLACDSEDTWSRSADSATDFVTDYECGGEAVLDLDGPELVYAVVAPYDGRAVLRALALAEEARILVLEAEGRGCDPRSCRDVSTTEIDFALTKERTVYVVVDAPSGVDPEFSLQLSCTPRKESDCNDDRDEDRDGQTDCDDEDCRNADVCDEAAERPLLTLDCGAAALVAGHSGGESATDEHSVYGCGVGFEVLSGPELRYGFRAPVTGSYAFTLSRATAPLELVALASAERGGACLGRARGGLSLDLAADEEIVVIVDGADEAGAAFELGLACPAGVELRCDDGTDDDGDGDTDCADGDCALVSPCVGGGCPGAQMPVECDQWVHGTTATPGATSSLVDYPCSLFPFVGPELRFPIAAEPGLRVVARLEEVDEDLDVFLISAPDGACGAEYCVTQGNEAAQFIVREDESLQAIVDGYGGTSGPFSLSISCYSGSEVDCSDGEDGDGDGDIDCRDEDCYGTAACPLCTPDPVPVLGCDEPYRISTNAVAATGRIERYGCSNNTYSGRERVFAFTPVYSGRVSFLLDERTADLDILLLEADGEDCVPSRCVDYSPYRIRRTVAGEQRYYVVIDGYDGAVGEATLTLECEDW